jgi:DNA-binding response OmpR family regulator
MRILLVEDNADTSTLLARGLSLGGCEVLTVSTVAQALEILIKESFDVIISDVGLPDGHGIGLISGVRGFCDTPAIALTAFSAPADIQRCLDAGFNLHLAKPSELSVILREIQRLVREHRDKAGARQS